MRRTLLGTLLAGALLVSAWGCAPGTQSSESPEEQIDTGALTDEYDGETPDVTREPGATRPTVKQAQAVVLEIASETYPDALWNSVTVQGIGLDPGGVWWVQAWTSTGREGDESEQWFVTYDGSSWEYQDSGTGMDRTDYPSDIVWEDVE